MTDSGDCQPSTDFEPLYERLDAVRAKLRKLGAAYRARRIDFQQFVIAATPLWDEQDEVENELRRAFLRLAGIPESTDFSRDLDHDRTKQLSALFELPFGYQHSLHDYQLSAKITWFCTARGTHDPLLVVFRQPHEVPGADRRTRQLLVLRDIHDGIRRLEAAVRKEVTGHTGRPRPPDEITAGVPHREHVEMACVECGRQLRLGGRQLNRAGRSGVTEVDISLPLLF
jgi:hypothetical protein